MTEATEGWKSTVDELGAQVMPPTTSIDIEDYSDYKTNCKSPIFSLKYIVS